MSMMLHTIATSLRVRWTTLVLIPLLAGCYVYRPVTGTLPETSDRIRFALTDSGTALLAAQLGPSTVELSGRLIGSSGDSYVVSVLETRARNGIEADWRGEQVMIHRSFVAHADQRRFSRSRTVLMGVGTVVVALGARAAFWGPGKVFGGGGPGPGPGPR
jgi:hypothetical protein